MAVVLVEHYPSPLKLEVLGVFDWPESRESGQREFAGVPTTETSYILEGAARISFADQPPVEVSEGDLVTIMPHTACVWIITKAIVRHYSNG